MAILKIGDVEINCENLTGNQIQELNSTLGDLGCVLEEDRYVVKGKTLREFMLWVGENLDSVSEELKVDKDDLDTIVCGIGKGNVYVMDLLDGYMSKVYDLYENGNEISYNVVSFIELVAELCISEIEEVFKDSRYLFDLNGYTLGKYVDVLNYVNYLRKENGIEIGADFRYVLYKDKIGNCKHKIVDNIDGIETYINNCLSVGEYIPYSPISDFFRNYKEKYGMELYHDNSVQSCDYFITRYDEKMSNTTLEILKNVFKINITGYLIGDGSHYCILKLDGNKLSMINWSVELLGFDDCEYTDFRLNGVIRELVEADYRTANSLDKVIALVKEVYNKPNEIILDI